MDIDIIMILTQRLNIVTFFTIILDPPGRYIFS